MTAAVGLPTLRLIRVRSGRTRSGGYCRGESRMVADRRKRRNRRPRHGFAADAANRAAPAAYHSQHDVPRPFLRPRGDLPRSAAALSRCAVRLARDARRPSAISSGTPAAATVRPASHSRRVFARVFATDPSASQIENAETRANIDYRVEPGEQCTLPSASADLVTVAQALHWFDFARFFAEAGRVLKPRGVLAAWAYSDCRVTPAVDVLKDRVYVDLTGPYWPPEREFVDAGYRTIPFPFGADAPFEEIEAPPFVMSVTWDVAAVSRVSALVVGDAALHQDEGRGSGRDGRTRTHARPGAIPEAQREVRWDFHVRCGRLNALGRDHSDLDAEARKVRGVRAALMTSARVSDRRRSHPFSMSRRASNVPSGPDRWKRRSVQSTQVRPSRCVLSIASASTPPSTSKRSPLRFRRTASLSRSSPDALRSRSNSATPRRPARCW